MVVVTLVAVMTSAAVISKGLMDNNAPAFRFGIPWSFRSLLATQQSVVIKSPS
jgi:hypothetical protein